MCNKSIVENGETLKFVPDNYKNQKMGSQAVDNYVDVLESVPKCFKPQEICEKAVATFHFVFNYFPALYKNQKISDKPFSEDCFMLKYCLHRHKTQELCNKTVDNVLPTLKFVPDWFVTKNMIKKLYIATFADDNILFFENILAMLHLQPMKWVCFVQILTQSIWKRNRKRVNACSMASNKMVLLVPLRRWEKRNRTNFYW